MRTELLFLLAFVVIVTAGAYATDRVDRIAGDRDRPSAGDPYPRRSIEDQRPAAERAGAEDPGLLGSILPARDSLWSYLVTAALVTVIAVVWWIFFAVSLKGACWFSLVEASLFRCAVLALFITVISLVCFGAAAYFHGSGAHIWSPDVRGGMALLGTAVLYFLAAVAFTKLLLKCKWRSVLTIWIMSTFVANAIVWSTYIGLLAALPAEAAALP